MPDYLRRFALAMTTLALCPQRYALAPPADNTAALRCARTCRRSRITSKTRKYSVVGSANRRRRIRCRLDRPANRPDAQNARRDRRSRKRRGAIRFLPPALARLRFRGEDIGRLASCGIVIGRAPLGLPGRLAGPFFVNDLGDADAVVRKDLLAADGLDIMMVARGPATPSEPPRPARSGRTAAGSPASSS